MWGEGTVSMLPVTGVPGTTDVPGVVTEAPDAAVGVVAGVELGVVPGVELGVALGVLLGVLLGVELGVWRQRWMAPTQSLFSRSDPGRRYRILVPA